MARKTAAPKNDKGFEESLWDSANRLRGNVESSEYKHIVLSLIFLKFVSDKFEERRAELVAEGKEQYADMKTDSERGHRNREGETLSIDARKMGQNDTGEVDLFDPDYLAKIEKLKGVDFTRQFKALVEK